jgi:hypothetical protein
VGIGVRTALGGDKLSTQGRAFEFEPMGAMNDAAEDRVTERGVGDHLVPFTDWDLAGDRSRLAVVAVVNDLEQVAAVLDTSGGARSPGGPFTPWKVPSFQAHTRSRPSSGFEQRAVPVGKRV